ncbi:MAG: DUF3467 domain-containing protein [Candidatus Coatesbacteria bacterium]|nr:DUF3467 domain-containing protein [Candidatus Coatesbacteria bacterium]
MPDKPEDKPRRMRVELPDNVAAGNYTNAAHIAVTPAEFIIDFARALPGVKKIKVHSRMILPPLAAKALAKRLEQAVAGYEKKFGEIKQPGGRRPPFDFGSFDGDPSVN